MEKTKLEKVGDLATERITEINKVNESKVETKDATDKDKKVEGTKNIADIEKQFQEDERILGADEKTLTEPEVKRKAEILETKKKKAESPEEKEQRIEKSVQKRIDEIKSELLSEKNKRTQDAELIKKLQDELDSVKKTIQPKVESDEKNRLKQLEAERINKYVEEDKSKPKADRREMTKEDLEEWYLEDPLGATEWMQERRFRRVEELKELQESITKDKAKIGADDFISKQNESKAKLLAKFPKIQADPKRIAELKSEGKSDVEIREIISEENEEFRLCAEIVTSDPRKYLQSINGPELVMAEMEKRLSKKDDKITLTKEELEERIQAELTRRSSLDEGITSTKGKLKMDKENQKSEKRQHLERIAKKANIKIEDLDKTIARRQNIPGSNTFEDNRE